MTWPFHLFGIASTGRRWTYQRFGSYEATFKIGSAWVWLVVDKTGKLQVTSTQNQDNPLMKKLLFRNSHFGWIVGTCLLSWLSIPKKNYIDSFFNVINWPKVGENYEAAFRKKY
jgi:Fe-Mn family superoxide dismutase